jgi:hypothetical protein
LNVLITPHTHLDVGWLETFDSYYYLNVSKIIPGVLDNLAKDSSKRFSWAEISYFQVSLVLVSLKSTRSPYESPMGTLVRVIESL